MKDILGHATPDHIYTAAMRRNETRQGTDGLQSRVSVSGSVDEEGRRAMAYGFEQRLARGGKPLPDLKHSLRDILDLSVTKIDRISSTFWPYSLIM